MAGAQVHPEASPVVGAQADAFEHHGPPLPQGHLCRVVRPGQGGALAVEQPPVQRVQVRAGPPGGVVLAGAEQLARGAVGAKQAQAVVEHQHRVVQRVEDGEVEGRVAGGIHRLDLPEPPGAIALRRRRADAHERPRRARRGTGQPQRRAHPGRGRLRQHPGQPFVVPGVEGLGHRPSPRIAAGQRARQGVGIAHHARVAPDPQRGVGQEIEPVRTGRVIRVEIRVVHAIVRRAEGRKSRMAILGKRRPA